MAACARPSTLPVAGIGPFKLIGPEPTVYEVCCWVIYFRAIVRQDFVQCGPPRRLPAWIKPRAGSVPSSSCRALSFSCAWSAALASALAAPPTGPPPAPLSASAVLPDTVEPVGSTGRPDRNLNFGSSRSRAQLFSTQSAKPTPSREARSSRARAATASLAASALARPIRAGGVDHSLG